MENETHFSQPISYRGSEKFIFVSYAHKDDENDHQISRIIRKLQDKGFRVWYDYDIEKGSDWADFIGSRIRECGAFLFFQSDHSLRSNSYCRVELLSALAIKREAVVPVQMEDSPDEASLDEFGKMIKNTLHGIQNYKFDEELIDKITSDHKFLCCRSDIVRIEEGRTSVFESEFVRNQSLMTVTIPSSVTQIDDWAFYGCDELRVILGGNFENLRSLGNAVFSECKKLHTLDLSKARIKRIGHYTIHGCTDLTSLKLPSTVTSIGYMGISFCKSLVKLDLPDNLKKLDESAFSCCESLQEITIPKGVRIIDRKTFSGCRSLSKVVLPNGIKYIGEKAFKDCSLLNRIEIDGTDYDLNKFINMLNKSGSYTEIGDNAFEGCASLSGIVSMPRKEYDRIFRNTNVTLA